MNETENLIKRLDKDDDSKILNDDKFSEIIWSEEFNWSVWIHLNSWHSTLSMRQCLNRWWMKFELMTN
jgi:myosin-crossreactive antigen